MTKLACWEFMKCGREEGGSKSDELGVCPAATDGRAEGLNSGRYAGRSCWAVAGTLCGGKIHGSSALRRAEGCTECEFYKLVAREEGVKFHDAGDITAAIKNIFSVGLPVVLNIPKSSEEIFTAIMGWECGSCLIVKLPYADGRPVKLQSADECQLKFIRDDNAFWFSTEVISIQNYPVPLIFFRYPKTIRKIPFRQNKRFHIHISALLTHSGEEVPIEAVITNLSEQGCQVRILSAGEASFAVNEEVKLRFDVLNTSFDKVVCTVRNKNRIAHITSLGLEFAALESRNRETIQSILSLLN